MVLNLLRCTLLVLRDEGLAARLAQSDGRKGGRGKEGGGVGDYDYDNDPARAALFLRLHVYVTSDSAFRSYYPLSDDPDDPPPLHILEKSKMMDLITTYTASYVNLLKLASTPLPFPLVQMGRTFLFLWTFTIPFALVGIVSELFSVLIFVFFLT